MRVSHRNPPERQALRVVAQKLPEKRYSVTAADSEQCTVSREGHGSPMLTVRSLECPVCSAIRTTNVQFLADTKVKMELINRKPRHKILQ